MKPSTIVIAIVALGAVLAGVIIRGGHEKPVREYVESRDLDGRLSEVGAADSRLMEQISHRLGLDGESEPEIDLYQPSEADFRFLMETFHGRDPAARRSAARALVAIQDPRAVGALVRATGTPDEMAWYCAGAQEILRVLTREQAAGLMIDLIEDRERPPTASCLAELKEKFRLVGGDSPAILVELLSHDSVRVRGYALRHLPPSGDPGVTARVQELGALGDPEMSRLAGEWLAQAAALEPSPASMPAPGPPPSTE